VFYFPSVLYIKHLSCGLKISVIFLASFC